MHSVLQGRQLVHKIGAQDVNVSITLRPAAHTAAQERSSAIALVEAAAPPPKVGKNSKSASNTISLMATASLGRSIAMFVRTQSSKFSNFKVHRLITLFSRYCLNISLLCWCCLHTLFAYRQCVLRTLEGFSILLQLQRNNHDGSRKIITRQCSVYGSDMSRLSLLILATQHNDINQIQRNTTFPIVAASCRRLLFVHFSEDQEDDGLFIAKNCTTRM